MTNVVYPSLDTAGDIYKRIFHHQPVIASEVQHFISEFESKRHGKEFTDMEDIELKLQNIPTMLEQSCCLLQDHIPELATKSRELIGKMSDILIIEEAERSAEFSQNAEARTEQWNKFMEEIIQKSREADEAHDRAVADLANKYVTMDQNDAEDGQTNT